MSASNSRVPAQLGRRNILIRCAILAVLVLAYRLSFMPLHGVFGNPTFLLGQLICLTSAALLGLRGALVVIVIVALLDRSFALSMPLGPETGRTAAVIVTLVKLLLSGGLGLIVDSRRRTAALNARLRDEIESREQSEQSLRHSEELHRVLVESLGEGVGLFDAADRVVFANQALASTLQVARDELLGKSFGEFLVKSSREPLTARTIAGTDVLCYEVALRSSASTSLLVTETKLSADGPHGATLRVVRDFTERIMSDRRQRDLERELQRSQALQSLAVMAGGVAHDFNNLLCGVVGNAQLAQRKLTAGAQPVVAQCLTEIVTFSSEAAQLSKQMLAYAGRRSLGIEALEVNVELSGALRLLHGTVESKARLILSLAEGLPEVAADRFQLRQVVTNLVLNALDAMEGKRGTLTLRSETLHLPTQHAEYKLAAGDYVKITVEDTGLGIANEVRERVFEPFFSTKAPGRGMGLAAAAGIVRTHRGWIGIEHTSPKGTRFALLLPVARASTPRPKSTPAPATEPPPPRNILLIDDEPAVRIVTGRLLNELGHNVMTADSGQHGVELFSEQSDSIDLVVLDLTMPEKSGEQILDELRLVRGDIPVVITSGFQAQDASKLLRVSNVVGFLDKPHTLTNLELLIAAVSKNTPAADTARAS
jgi:two-component system, cell cycle sensor histidine kinase and response regulator CckA